MASFLCSLPSVFILETTTYSYNTEYYTGFHDFPHDDWTDDERNLLYFPSFFLSRRWTFKTIVLRVEHLLRQTIHYFITHVLA